MTTYQAQLRNVRGIGSIRYQTILNKLGETKQSLLSLFTMQPETIKAQFGVPIHVARAIADIDIFSERSQAHIKPEQPSTTLIHPDIIALSRDDEHYPQRLKALFGDKAPETLYIWGNLDLLNYPTAGFCGSRDVSNKGIKITIDTAEQLSSAGWVIVSGHTRGVDTIAHRTALENNAGTILVLPQGFNDFRLRSSLKRIATKENLLIISEFEPGASWAIGRAMQRNRTIAGLSDVMLLLESRMEGGTFHAGQTALRLNRPLYIPKYREISEETAGNDHLLRQGAIPLGKDKQTGRANIRPILARADLLRAAS